MNPHDFQALAWKQTPHPLLLLLILFSPNGGRPYWSPTAVRIKLGWPHQNILHQHFESLQQDTWAERPCQCGVTRCNCGLGNVGARWYKRPQAICCWSHAFQKGLQWWPCWGRRRSDGKITHHVYPALFLSILSSYILGCDLSLADSQAVFCCVYRLPNSSRAAENSLIMLLSSLFEIPKRTILVGDLNAGYIN